MSEVICEHDVWKEESTWTRIFEHELGAGQNRNRDKALLVKFKELRDLLMIYKVDSKIGIGLIAKYGKLLNLRWRELILELKCVQFNNAREEAKSIHKKSKNLQNRKESASLFIIKRTLKYIADTKDLMHILLLSRSTNDLLRFKLIKAFSLRTEYPQDFSSFRSFLNYVSNCCKGSRNMRRYMQKLR